MAVIKSKNANKYSISAFNLLFFTKFLIAEPNAAQGDIDRGQIIRAINAFSLLFLTKFLIDEPKAAQGDIDNGQMIRAIVAI